MRLIALALLSSFALTAQADFAAYSVSEHGDVPLPENIDGIDPQYLVNLRWGDYEGARARVGVLEVDNTSAAGSYSIAIGGEVAVESSYAQVPVNGIEAIITDAMSRTGRFRLVERQALGSILAEQDLATSGRVAKPSGAATGNILGAQYLVQAVVTNYEADTAGKDFGVGGLLRNKVPILGGVKVKNRKGVVGMNFRLIDAETSEIIYTKQVDTQVTEKGLSLGGVGFGSNLALGGFLSNYAKTPIGQAVIASCNEGVFDLIKQIGTKPAEGSVVKADAQGVFVNLGQDQVALGDNLQVLSVGEELIDPDTGISLGAEESVLGDIRVVRVAEKFSVAQPVNPGITIGRGDRVRSTKLPPQMEYAAEWQKPKKSRKK